MQNENIEPMFKKQEQVPLKVQKHKDFSLKIFYYET